jgi:tetratricopeptide (TPR) repeat protein
LRYDAYFKLAIAHIDSAYNKSIEYWNKALEIAKKRKYWELSADAYHQLGYMLLKKAEFVKSLEFFKEALNIYEQTGNLLGTAAVYNDIGLVYKNWGKYDTALDNYLLAQKYYEKTQSEEGMGIVYNNIGQIYFFREDYLKAIDYFKQYLEINKKSKYYRAVAAASNNIASAYMELGSFNFAYDFFLSSLRIYDSLDIKLGVAIIQDNIGTLFLKKGQYFDALLYHTRSLEIFRQLGSTSRECISLKNIGLVYYKLKKYPDAIKYFDASLAIAFNLKMNETLQELYLYLAQAHESSHSDVKALGYYKLFTQIKDSLQRVETAEKLGLLESRLEAENKTRQLELLKKELEREKQTKTYLYFSVFGIILSMIIIFYFLIKSISLKRRVNELALNNRDVEFISKKTKGFVLNCLSKHFQSSFCVDIEDRRGTLQHLMHFEHNGRTILLMGECSAESGLQSRFIIKAEERIENAKSTLSTPSEIVNFYRQIDVKGTEGNLNSSNLNAGCIILSASEGFCSFSGELVVLLKRADDELVIVPRDTDFSILKDETIYLYQISSENSNQEINGRIEETLRSMGPVPIDLQQEVVESAIGFIGASSKESFSIKFIAIKV